MKSWKHWRWRPRRPKRRGAGGPGPEIMDGSHGVAMQLERKLAQSGMLRQCGEPGTAVFENSLDEPEILALSRALFRYRDE